MKSSFHFSQQELTDLIASVLATNGHGAVSGLTLLKDGTPIDFDEARIDVNVQLIVRCTPEKSKYDKVLERYFQSIGQIQEINDESE